MYKMSIK